MYAMELAMQGGLDGNTDNRGFALRARVFERIKDLSKDKVQKVRQNNTDRGWLRWVVSTIYNKNWKN